ncbi:putative disease resistance RPP13-like protein 1 [Cornus florida]|uniref:putative disease resistance RPP13-like protein 1 n=1 Tax=Cornus florida TaxID=4283 RepID=UPI002897A226|nr:putative disease resistance RPP13-like protein 1 [Cornus florida]XP_059652689.1 putative disease resistance RPP13-like protein 1 [Cornus florida]XP_059652690.1 putative disease resistance RPP13-like protein 1 [Cornus florida]XP_059652691.1 putative disease resistance RPP13-like protein 1 [Cornus florida]XP_059652693.1 putative disease resistance RPP13-like protein 1 [Cornus florida]XP_059652694.1 putative disease resistance RPP13-like protein 1 [Cornus florida]
MAEMVVGALLSASFDVLLDRLASPEFKSFFSKQKFDDGLRSNMKTKLLALQVVLDDAEDKQITNPAVKAWLDEVQHVVYQADDLLDEIATKALRHKLEADDHHPPQTQSSTSIVRRFLHLMKQFLLRINCFVSTPAYHSDNAIESMMKEVISKLDEFINQKNSLYLMENVGRQGTSHLPNNREETSLVNESQIYGRNKDKEDIMKLLTDDIATGNQIPVISIVGMGGLGKTTLAQHIYNDTEVHEKFHLKAWVCVSDSFDSYRITKKILDDVTETNNNIDNIDKLQINLKESLAGKKFLIVLDDVWNDDYNVWDSLRKPFIGGAQGSRIIITTRSDNVASAMGAISSHHLEPLLVDDSWSLFASHAFVNEGHMPNSELEKIGREIVKKCGGLPLAVKSLGGLLGSNQDIEHWKKILESKIWGLKEKNVIPALRLSYQYLPSYLKRCFAYCSKFPKDYEFEKEKLVRLWIAEDLVPQQPKSKNSVEEEGNDYFHELLSRSFFQRLSDSPSYFVMHDLLNDLAQDISGKFSVRLDDDKPLHNICEKVRHFSYLRCEYDAFEKFKVINEVKCLRSFISFRSEGWSFFLGSKVLHDMLPTLRYLRVLSLSRYEIHELPQPIENLIHLRYLDLSRTRLKRLPNTVTTLCNLQTLDLSFCEDLIELPVNMGKLVKLRYLDIRKTRFAEMPMQMSKLKDLQRLTDFVVGKDGGSRISGLKELSQLRGQLCISELQNVTSGPEASEANLKGKEHLEGLELKWGSDTDNLQNERVVLDNLHPHAGVKHLRIINYGGTRFSNWLEKGDLLRDMVSLDLIGCKNCSSLPSIGQLPSLKYLTIENMNAIRKVGGELYGNASSSIKPFKSLETLRFHKMAEWEEWDASGIEEFSRLIEFSIDNCPKLTSELSIRTPILTKLNISGSNQVRLLLQGLPCIQELKIPNIPNLTELPQQMQHLSSLQKLEISRMSNLKELPHELCRLVNLERLKIKECPRLVSFPDMGLPPKLKTLKISKCEGLQSLASEEIINNCLEELRISDCLSLRQVSFPIATLKKLGIKRCEALQSLAAATVPSEEINNIRLEELHIFNCSSLVKVSLPIATLKTLNISSCRRLEFPLSEEMKEYNYSTSIEVLSINESCDLLKSLWLGFFPKLRDLYINSCMDLETLLIPTMLQHLITLRIVNCPKMVSFPHGGGDGGVLLAIPNLMYLTICGCKNLKRLPHQMHTLQSLNTFQIKECPEVESFPDEGLPSNLRRLDIINCNKLMKGRMRWDLQQKLPSLEVFSIKSENEEEELESFPEECLLPTTLTRLYIWNFSNLKALNHKGLQHLTSLTDLTIWNCPKLRSLPEEGLPNSLSFLGILGCPLLEPRCQREKGEDWSKISRIRRIQLDFGEDIINLE